MTSLCVSKVPSPSLSSNTVILSAPFAPRGGGSGTLSKLRAEMMVVTDDLQPGGKLILKILRDPEPAARIEAHVERLRHGRLGRDEIDRQPFAQRERLQRIGRRERLASHRSTCRARQRSP